MLASWAAQAHAACGGRVMRPDTLHLTLAFLGAVETSRVAELAATTRTQRIPPGHTRLDRYGAFPRLGIVWAGPAHTGGDLQDTHDSLWRWLQPLGWHPPQHAFRPHVTLLRHASRLPPPDTPPSPVEWRYHGYMLVESQPDTGTARYRILAATDST